MSNYSDGSELSEVEGDPIIEEAIKIYDEELEKQNTLASTSKVASPTTQRKRRCTSNNSGTKL